MAGVETATAVWEQTCLGTATSTLAQTFCETGSQTLRATLRELSTGTFLHTRSVAVVQVGSSTA